MGYLAVSYNFQGETGYIIAVVRKTSAPLVEIDRETTPAPHSQHSWLIENLDPVWHTVKFYRSVDGVALDEEILTLAGNALTGAVYPISKYEYVVNRGYNNTAPDPTGSEVWNDPVANDTGVRDERLADKIYWIEERGTGTFLAAEIVDRTDDGGGFDFSASLISDGKVMNEGGVYIATVIERVDAAPSSGGGSSDYNDIVEITEDTDLDPIVHAGKVLIANWASNIGILTAANLSLQPDWKFKLTTHGGTQSFAGIQLDTGDTVEFLKDDKNIVWVGSGEMIECMFKNNTMYITDDAGDFRRVGQRIWGDINVELNAILRDGTRYLETDLPRLVQWINVMGIATVAEGTGSGQWGFSEVVDGETIYPNKGYFTLEGGQVRVPDDRDKAMIALKNTDGSSDSERRTQGAGGFQQNKYRDHYHETGTETHTPAEFRRGSVHPIRAWPGSAITTNFAASTDDATLGAGIKTRPDNTGMLPLLIV